jgi:hypothetical protein
MSERVMENESRAKHGERRRGFMTEDESDSFELIDSGRTGMVIYRRGRRRIDLDWELLGGPGFNVCFFGVDLRYWWGEPRGEPIPRDQQIQILYKLRSWLKSRRIGSDIELPDKIEFEDRPCIWAGCNEPRMKGVVYCLRHRDENVLALEGMPREEMKELMKRSGADKKE